MVLYLPEQLQAGDSDTYREQTLPDCPDILSLPYTA